MTDWVGPRQDTATTSLRDALDLHAPMVGLTDYDSLKTQQEHLFDTYMAAHKHHPRRGQTQPNPITVAPSPNQLHEYAVALRNAADSPATPNSQYHETTAEWSDTLLDAANNDDLPGRARQRLLTEATAEVSHAYRATDQLLDRRQDDSLAETGALTTIIGALILGGAYLANTLR